MAAEMIFIVAGKKDKGSLRTGPEVLFSLSGNFRNRTFFNALTKGCKYKVKVTTERLDLKKKKEP